MIIDANSTYYVTDCYFNKILIYNEDWAYIDYKYFGSPRYICSVRKHLYITSTSGIIYKTDKYLNVIDFYNSTVRDSVYEGIHCDSKNNLIYVVATRQRAIYIFDSSLILKDSILTPTYYPYSITENENRIYIGASLENLVESRILVIENKTITKTLKVCTGNDYVTITSVLFDRFGLMATTCWIRQIYLYDENSVYSGSKSLSTLNYQYYIGFDSKGRFLILTEGQISLFY